MFHFSNCPVTYYRNTKWTPSMAMGCSRYWGIALNKAKLAFYQRRMSNTFTNNSSQHYIKLNQSSEVRRWMGSVGQEGGQGQPALVGESWVDICLMRRGQPCEALGMLCPRQKEQQVQMLEVGTRWKVFKWQRKSRRSWSGMRDGRSQEVRLDRRAEGKTMVDVESLLPDYFY